MRECLAYRCKGSSALGHEIGHFRSFRSPRSCHASPLISDIATNSLVFPRLHLASHLCFLHPSLHLTIRHSLPRCIPVPSSIVGCPSLLRPGTVLLIFLYFTPCLTFSLRLMVTHSFVSCDHLLYRLVTRYVLVSLLLS